ncbi:Putative secreted protein OS=Rhodopirellula sp. SWK7 GN=RRSWK_05138 PE=4 SV=1 [Gemmataceae bacterium]|nr:Putative secreted protein OS=Rhodopirellula sp. SWK7 GN=RRSWK_05138 PE=4 SV=1 [Gemmataceae bacterium]VTU01257.1 Putative secreted protein OS=Rhodopirellula sp. SWK7 GN=RRSWK_05138 PE=4 SV=1 [Gemmataceae bacterium]
MRINCVTLLALLALAPCGCGPRTTYGEVEGVVTVDGRPLPKVEVRFMPEPGGGSAARAVGYTDANGHYRLTLDGGEPGVAVGSYVVCLADPTAKRPGSGPVKGRAAARPRFAVEFTDASRTPLRDYKVQPGRQTINLAATTASR